MYELLNDNTHTGTQNRLMPGAAFQVHTFKGSSPFDPDQDWFRVWVHPYRSYEVQLRNVATVPFLLQRVGLPTQEPILQSGSTFPESSLYSLGGGLDGPADPLLGFTTTPNGREQTLTWIERPGAFRTGSVRVMDTDAANPAYSDQTYAIALRESTLYCPRYNNSGSQLGVLLIQRISTHEQVGGTAQLTCEAEARFYNESGYPTGLSVLGNVFPRSVTVVQTISVPGVGGTQGNVMIPHTCGYGGLQAKLVQLDPTTGFSFDTICTERSQ